MVDKYISTKMIVTIEEREGKMVKVTKFYNTDDLHQKVVEYTQPV